MRSCVSGCFASGKLRCNRRGAGSRHKANSAHCHRRSAREMGEKGHGVMVRKPYVQTNLFTCVRNSLEHKQLVEKHCKKLKGYLGRWGRGTRVVVRTPCASVFMCSGSQEPRLFLRRPDCSDNQRCSLCNGSLTGGHKSEGKEAMRSVGFRLSFEDLWPCGQLRHRHMHVLPCCGSSLLVPAPSVLLPTYLA